ncbi:hypothetical protein TEA_015283 [Camellia sinensis var. sinensis]|uniref:Uncharacterized protein n=1 Tax=Camellia sinensis var. sinensis TaxID=542762 RepID=A0A4S4EQD5_CAMSN|nr:hypothetical protein TEA_015283 [Camellia sinensis var. sinensis]
MAKKNLCFVGSFVVVVVLSLVFCAETLSRHAFPFPPDFVFRSGTTTAYQSEGAAFQDGRTASIWDTFAHAETLSRHEFPFPPDFVFGSGTTAYQEDVQLMVETGLEAYRANKVNSCARTYIRQRSAKKKKARKKGEKLHVYVNRVLNAITGGNATPATNELGLQIRRLCPLQSMKSWRKIDQSTKDAVIQAVLDKFVIGDDFDNDEQAQQILNRKTYLLYKDWRYNLKQEFLELEEKGC